MYRKVILGLCVVLSSMQYATAIDMTKCAQIAIAKGIASLDLPSHDPLVIPRNFSLHWKNFLSNEFILNISTVTWTNLPWWEVREDKQLKNTSEITVSEGALWWDNFTISFDYILSWGQSEFNGEVQFLYKDITWNATWEETKPDRTGAKKLNYLHIRQVTNGRSVKTTGLGLLTGVTEAVLLSLSDIALEVLVNDFNFFGQAFGYKINKVWYGNVTVYNSLVAWCESQNITTNLY